MKRKLTWCLVVFVLAVSLFLAACKSTGEAYIYVPSAPIAELKIGGVIASSEPAGAKVLVDGKDTGAVTPATVKALVGNREIKLAKEGYFDYVGNVFVVEGLYKEINGILTKAEIIRVSSSPDSINVFVDGEYKGNTPKDIPVVAGRHRVKFQAASSQEQETTIEVSPGQTTALKGIFDAPIRIERCIDSDGGRDYHKKGYTVYGATENIRRDSCEGRIVQEAYCEGINLATSAYTCSHSCSDGVCQGAIKVSSAPGAQLYIDGIIKGAVTTITVEIPGGSHSVKLVKSGYATYERLLEVTAGQVATVSVTLTPSTQTGSISASSNPSGAKVFLDGIEKGFTPITLTGVIPGHHTVKFTKSGYRDYTTLLDVAANQVSTVRWEVTS